jgi:hypothetical protein
LFYPFVEEERWVFIAIDQEVFEEVIDVAIE